MLVGGGMEWLVAPQYWMARLVFQRLLGVVYLVAFVSPFSQFAALAGERGLLPCRPYLREAIGNHAPSSSWRWRCWRSAGARCETWGPDTRS